MIKTKIYYLNWEKDWELINKVDYNNKELIKLKLGQELYDNLNQIVIKQFQIMKEITPISSHHRELNKDSYKSAVYSLIYKWEKEKLGLLDIWAQLGVKLARSQYFTNGNKRTALLSMVSFIYACGFEFQDQVDNKILLQKWEKLLLDIVTSDNEELAIELTKERILWELKFINNHE